MNDYLEQEILRLNREILRLKTSMQKSAGVVPTISKSISLNIPLELNASQTISNGEKYFKVVPNKDALIMPTLDWYFEDVLENDHFPYLSRGAGVIFFKSLDGDYILRVYVRGNTSDTSALIGGASVNVSVELNVRCTDDFIIEEL